MVLACDFRYIFYAKLHSHQDGLSKKYKIQVGQNIKCGHTSCNERYKEAAVERIEKKGQNGLDTF